MLLIYVTHITPRTQYVFDLFFNNIVLLQYTLTADKAQFLEYPGPKISYADTAVSYTHLDVYKRQTQLVA